MIKGSITYRKLVDVVYNYIMNKCLNIRGKDENGNDIDRFSTLPSSLKAGYSFTKQIDHTWSQIFSGPCRFVPTAICQIVPTTSVIGVSSYTIKSQLDSFLNDIGVYSKLDTQIADGEFYKFVNDLILFCCSKVCFATSQFTPNKYLIYCPNDDIDNSLVEKIAGDVVDIIEASDVNEILFILTNILNSNIRQQTVKYTYTLKN